MTIKIEKDNAGTATRRNVGLLIAKRAKFMIGVTVAFLNIGITALCMSSTLLEPLLKVQ